MAENIVWHEGATAAQRREALGYVGATLWFTGLSGSGKSTVAVGLEHELLALGRPCYRLDGDNVRHGLNANLGFSPEDRQENIRRVGEVAKLFGDSGCITLASFISPYAEDRAKVRAMHTRAGVDFIEVHVAASIEVCEDRDPKGLYKKARAGEIQQFTGVDAPYEIPEDPELVLRTDTTDLPGCIAECLTLLRQRGVL